MHANSHYPGARIYDIENGENSRLRVRVCVGGWGGGGPSESWMMLHIIQVLESIIE